MILLLNKINLIIQSLNFTFMKKVTQKQTKYQHLIVWCQMMGSYQYYTDRQVSKAEQLNSPINTIYFNNDTPVTFDSCTNPEAIAYFKRYGLD